MKKLISAIVLGALVTTTIMPTQSFAVIPVPPPSNIPPGGGGGAGGAGGIIGVVTFLVIYDLIRRTTCSGDFLHLGGPGFTTKIKAGDTILTPPQCIPPKRKVLRARG